MKSCRHAIDSLPPCEYRVYQWPDLSAPHDFLTTRALETLEWAEKMMRDDSLRNQRDDYRELLELVVVYLGGKVIRKRKNGTYDQPEFHNALPWCISPSKVHGKEFVYNKNVDDARCYSG